MPKVSRKRTELHTSSVKLQSVQDNAVEHVNIGEASDVSGNDILHALSAPKPHAPVVTKKERQQLKREAFLQKLSAELSPYSKSHARRQKRKAKEEIAGGLNDLKVVITELEPDNQPDTGDEDGSSTNPKTSLKPGKIGEGKHLPLSVGQRKRALKLEQMRQPLVLSDPAFASNPFQAIRTHAQNTLVKHEVQNE
ncbi:Ribosome biogenesis protein SLX9 domain containing protein [Amanita muscaria]